MNTRLREWLVPGLVVAALGAIIVLGWTEREKHTPVRADSEAPDYATTTLAGEPITLAGFEGKVVVLNVWATWCPPCRFEMPSLQRLQDELGDEGLEVVAVSVDLEHAEDMVRDFAAEYALDFTIALDPDGRVERLFGVSGLPTTFVIDRQGVLREKIMGGREWDQGELGDRIRALVRGGEAP